MHVHVAKFGEYHENNIMLEALGCTGILGQFLLTESVLYFFPRILPDLCIVDS